MPYRMQWVDPELVAEYNDVKIYRVYKNDDFSHPQSYWFTPYKNFTEDSLVLEEYDIRVLLEKLIEEGHLAPGFSIERFEGDTWMGEHLENKRRVLKMAIKKGLIEAP